MLAYNANNFTVEEKNALTILCNYFLLTVNLVLVYTTP